jgi:quercetin dioxygenase-like cupin family protein
MTIKQIKEDLKTSQNPVAKSLHHGTDFKVLIVGFNRGMILMEHKAPIRAKLTVLEGVVNYKEANRVVKLMQYDEVEIPIGITHSVEAIEDSLCILTQGE